MRKHEIIANILKQLRLVDAEGVSRAQEVQTRDGRTLVSALVSLGLVDEEQACAAVAGGLRLEYLARDIEADVDAAKQLPAEFCRERRVVVLGHGPQGLRLAMADPIDYRTIQDVEFRTGQRVIPSLASGTTMRAMLARLGDRRRNEHALYELIGDVEPTGVVEAQVSEEEPETERRSTRAPIIKLVNVILSEAARVGASDIHVEPHAHHLQVRRRIDGILEDVMRIPQVHQAAVLSRLKIIASMDIAERRRPQDGRATLRMGDEHIDMRVSSLPTQFGEKIVIRLLDGRTAKLSLESLGFESDEVATLEALLTRPQGMILVTGPTGSGKTSTLYAALNWLRSPSKNIITVEDPVEYQLPGVNQVPINAKAGVTFAAGLRSILRQDPNVVLVGEIRDSETANIALEAAQTGHLLLSTVHTNDAPGTITRLLDLGVEPFLIASSLMAVLAQRLIRRPCTACAIPAAPAREDLARLGASSRLPLDAAWKAGVGCAACGGTGYKGRVAVHELLVVNDEMRELIGRRAPEDELREVARRAGMRTLTDDAITKAARGLTTVSEIVRAIPPDSQATERVPASTPAPCVIVPPRLAAPAPAPAPATGQSASILVVEDSATISAVVRYFLELEGFHVLTATDGAAGLELAQREHPQAIVADISMPGMDGITMVRALRASPETEDIAVLMLTGEDNIDSEADAMAAGADAYLLKPVEPRRLAAHVRALLKRAERVPVHAGFGG